MAKTTLTANVHVAWWYAPLLYGVAGPFLVWESIFGGTRSYAFVQWLVEKAVRVDVH